MEYPINDALPNIEHARDRLLAKIFEFRRGEHSRVVLDDDYEILYAYGSCLIVHHLNLITHYDQHLLQPRSEEKSMFQEKSWRSSTGC